MSINYSENKIALVLRSSKKLKIEYLRTGSSTTIKITEKLIQVDDNVFCEDLEDFLMYQKSFLQFFGVQFDRVDNMQEDYKPNKLESIVFMVSETLEILLKSRKYKIQVKRLFLELVDVDQVVSILNQLDLSVLRDVVIVFELGEGPIHLEELLDKILNTLNCWKLNLKLNKFTPDYLEILNKHRASSPFFQKFSINYKEIEDECFLLKLLNGLVIDKEKKCIVLKTEEGSNFNRKHKITKSTKPLMLAQLTKRYISYHTWSQTSQNPLTMQEITKNLSCFDIQQLRKVSKSIRDVIDLIKPDPNIEAVLISERAVEISLRNGERKWIFYKDHFSMGNDIGINLKHQKTSLKELRLDFLHVELLEIFKKSLTLRDAPLKVEKLTMNQPELLEIVPRLCSLKSIEIKSSSRENPEICLEKLSDNEQWKIAENLIIDSSIIICCSIRNINISNFKFVNISVKSLTINDMVYLTQIFLQTIASKKFKINFRFCDFDEIVPNFIGSPYAHMPGIRTIWYFRTASSGKWLHIVLHEWKTVIFSIVQQDLIPEGISEID
ncbi:hypothetical protein B9Z55_020994 [Caenorhabditis nigoni]|uniref:DUF38 domain-containing protein n=1 Tax=Caenorhabditis nigoni TaxID=1611254 RepID=A0A2G5TQA6_9PELO|nr:hypothetical protein B9Z55_020994 [Caenorhabditis nigoni]